MSRAKILASAAMLLSAVMGTAGAQNDYPAQKPITLVAPYAAGGGFDTLARFLADALGKHLGQRVIVQNIVGAGGVLGTRNVASAAPDGYTILLHHMGMATAPALVKDLQFDPLKSFAPVGLFAHSPMVVTGSPSLPAANARELIAYVKQNQDKVTFASSGIGSGTHLCAMLFESSVGTKITHIQYKGAGPAVVDIAGGRVDLLCEAPMGLIPHIRSGKVKGYLVTGDQPSASLPGLPAATNVGLNDLALATIWYGVYAPAKTPKVIIDRLSKSLQAVANDNDTAASLKKLEMTLFDAKDATPAALREQLASQLDLWKATFKKAGIEPQ